MAGSERQRQAVEAALAAEDRGRRPQVSESAVRATVSPQTSAMARPGESATSYIVGGLLMILVGLAMTGIGGVLLQEGSIVVGILIGGVGVILAVVGQLLGFMGVIAGGVRLGMRWHRYDAQR